MNTTPTDSLTSPQAPPPRRSRLWCIGRRCLIGFVTLVTLFVLFHVEENWRGKRAWTQYKAKMEAQGAVFELEKLIPPPVPDDQNFAMTPLLKPLLDMNPPGTLDAQGNEDRWRDPEGKARIEAVDLKDPDNWGTPAATAQPMESGGRAPGMEGFREPVPVPTGATWRLGERFNLADWQRYYSTSTNFPSWPEPRIPAEDVLKALSRFDAEIAELKQASRRPYSRFNIHYEEENPFGILLTHLKVIRNIARVVQLKAIAELGRGNADAAFEDVELMFALADSVDGEPILISHLVRIAVLQLTMQTIWEGLATHQWTPTHLEQLDQRLDAINLVQELRRSIEAERAFGAEMVELIVRNPGVLIDTFDGWTADSNSDSDVSANALVRLIPRGWWYLEGVNHSRAFDDYMLGVLTDRVEDLDAALIQTKWDELESRLGQMTSAGAFFRHTLLTRLLVPALGKVVHKSVEAQTFVDMGVIAIALERYRLANQSYPDALDQLLPDWTKRVPNDPVSHQPFLYQLLTGGSFRLWSVGWNGRDDGGEVLYEMRSGERRLGSRDQQSDWVWPSVNGMRLEEARQ